MSLHHDFITRAVSSAADKYGKSSVSEETVKVLSAAIYDILHSRDFERYIKELSK
jgi:hypothetical protein